MQPRSYCKCVLAIEMKKKKFQVFLQVYANLTSVVTMELKYKFFTLRCWFLRMMLLVVTSSTFKTSVKL